MKVGPPNKVVRRNKNFDKQHNSKHHNELAKNPCFRKTYELSKYANSTQVFAPCITYIKDEKDLECKLERVMHLTARPMLVGLFESNSLYYVPSRIKGRDKELLAQHMLGLRPTYSLRVWSSLVCNVIYEKPIRNVIYERPIDTDIYWSKAIVPCHFLWTSKNNDLASTLKSISDDMLECFIIYRLSWDHDVFILEKGLPDYKAEASYVVQGGSTGTGDVASRREKPQRYRSVGRV